MLSSNATWDHQASPSRTDVPWPQVPHTAAVGVIPRQMDFEELFQCDLEKKMQMKAFEDRKRNGKTSDIQVRDSVPVKQDLSSKASPPYEGEPLEEQHRKGTQVVVKRRDGSTITRSTAHFKKVPYQTLDEVGRSQLDPGFSRKPSAEVQAEVLPKPQERPGKVLFPGKGLSYTPNRVEPTTENVEEAPSSAGATARTARPCRSADEYLRSKFPDHEIPDRIQ